MSTVGDILSTVGGVQYRGDIMINVGDILSTVGVFSTVGDSRVPWAPRYSNFKGWYPPTVLNTPTVLMISPHVHHDIPHCTEHPPQYSR